MAQSSRERILDAAEARFAEKGFSATSVAEIADDVGIRGPSLYKHFDTKAALYHAVAKRLIKTTHQLRRRLIVNHPETHDKRGSSSSEKTSRETEKLITTEDVAHSRFAGAERRDFGAKLEVEDVKQIEPFVSETN